MGTIRSRKLKQKGFLILLLLLAVTSSGQESSTPERYRYEKGDSNGIGKWYMGREIAHVMGFQGIGWLERPEREREEHTEQLLEYMEIQPEDRIADIGAGSGYHVFKIAALATKGTVFAVDIQDEMLVALREKKTAGANKNVSVLKGAEKAVQLSENSVDKVLMVDVYHEFAFPFEMVASIKRALRPKGKLYLIEYRGEDDSVPIKKLHKMTEEQATREMEAAGFELLKNHDGLPWQHCMVFGVKQE